MASKTIRIPGTQEEVFSSSYNRISEDLQRFGGVMPEKYALVWHGHAAALQEWGLIEAGQYLELIRLLPKVEKPDPVMRIFSGWEES